METAINRWAEFWETLVDLPTHEREQMYLTMANEINACSHVFKCVTRES